MENTQYGGLNYPKYLTPATQEEDAWLKVLNILDFINTNLPSWASHLTIKYTDDKKDTLSRYKTIEEYLLENPKESQLSTPKVLSKLEEFEELYSLVELEMPEASKYKAVLTLICSMESNFNYSILNKANNPAYGYFQFWLDGKINNITKFSGLTMPEFLKDPKEQIKAAVKMATAIEKQLSRVDKGKAEEKGITLSGMIGGAWFGGIRGLRKVLNGTGNPSDKSKYSNGEGIDMISYIKKCNNL